MTARRNNARGPWAFWFTHEHTPARAWEKIGRLVGKTVVLEGPPGFLLEIAQARHTRWDKRALAPLAGNNLRHLRFFRWVLSGESSRWVHRLLDVHGPHLLGGTSPWLKPGDRMTLQTSVLPPGDERLILWAQGGDTCYKPSRLFQAQWGPVHAELWWAASHGVGARKCRCGRWFLLAGPRGKLAAYCHACREGFAAQQAYREILKTHHPGRYRRMEERRKLLARVRRGTMSAREFNRWAAEHEQTAIDPKRYPGIRARSAMPEA